MKQPNKDGSLEALVRRTRQMPDERRRGVVRLLREARLELRWAQSMQLSYKERYFLGQVAALKNVLKLFPKHPRKASGAANDEADRRRSEERKESAN